jgi:hypothetical protein
MPPFLLQPFFAHPDRHNTNMAPPNYHPECEYLPPYPLSQSKADTLSPAVTVTLRSIRPSAHQTRNIILRPDQPVNIGRSSRSQAKNLSAKTDNALFDCPVISRRHAELELNVNKWTQEKHLVYIKDTGSMHGTSVNGQKLQPTRPFQLQEGDIIRLGDSVNRADSEHSDIQPSFTFTNPFLDNYDGVTVTLECVSTANKKSYAQVKNSNQGYSAPVDSESEPECDEEEPCYGEAELHRSSAHTTPDQANVQSSSKIGSSTSNVITLEDDEDDEPIPMYNRRATEHSIVVPETFADDADMIEMVADSVVVVPAHSPAPRFSLQDGEAGYPNEGPASTEVAMKAIAPFAHVATVPITDDSFDHEDVNSEADSSAWGGDRDHMSDDLQDSDEHSESHDHEDSDGQSFLSEEFNMADEVAVQEDDEDEGPPEVMSSKRRLSNELGTLGDGPTYTSLRTTTMDEVPSAPNRPHYDPVRGFRVSAPSMDKVPAYRSYEPTFSATPFNLFADVSRRSKWDVGPGPVSVHSSFHNYNYVPQTEAVNNIDSGSRSNSWLNIPDQAVDADPLATASREFLGFEANPFATLNSPASAFPPVSFESNLKKRKAPGAEDELIFAQAPVPTINGETARTEDTVAATATPAVPQPKKRKVMQPHSQKSTLRTAVIEASKYTAGAIIGGIGLVTILASPIGEALASC